MQNFNFKFDFPGFEWLSALLPAIIAIAFAVLHLLFMKCIWNDGKKLEQGGRATVALTPFTWGLAALLTGLLAVALYWVAHYSSLARNNAAS